MDETKQLNTDDKDETSSIIELVTLMLSVDIDSPEAELNATSVSDGKGGRIRL